MNAQVTEKSSPSQSSDSPHATGGYVIGVDFGTLSGRALVVRVADGAELGSAVMDYPHGVMDRTLDAADGSTLPPDWALQAPNDYLAVLTNVVPRALEQAGIPASDVVGLGIDCTASTLLPVTQDGVPLSDLPEFATRRNAWTKLWKHHGCQPQADRITALAEARQEAWLSRYGGLTSAEWQLAKVLETLEEDPEVYRAARYFVEAGDWIIWQLTGQPTRSLGIAGYKGLYQGGYPAPDFYAELHPELGDYVATKLPETLVPLGGSAGRLTARGADLVGLPEGTAVAAANIDAHVTVPAADACEPGTMVLIMGTSTCHIVNGEGLYTVPGMCGVVEGGVTSGWWGYEAGQSGVGDIFAWFVDHDVPPEYHDQALERGLSVHELLTELSRSQAVGEHGLLALDWWSGNRSVLVDYELSGLLVGMTLTTRPEDIYRALCEATAFGTRTIVAAFAEAGVPITELVVAGGLMRNQALMQMYADVTRLPLSTIISEQGPALGAAIHAAVAAGVYPDVPTAAHAMGGRHRAAYLPDQARADAYDPLYADYLELHDYFGRGGNDVMHRLKARRRAAMEHSSQESAR